jgi:DNA-binding winged helix-turn-helix (wHTH) protein
MKPRLLITILLFSGALLLSASMFIRQNPQEEFLEKRAALVVRQIGHQLLLHSGDSTSRVLPVKQLGSGHFQLEFQSQLSFVPDTLVNLVRKDIASSELPLDYLVNVFECNTDRIVYGFEIGSTYKEIVPCLGRTQPKGCYTIQISFIDFQQGGNSNTYSIYLIALIGMTLIAFVGRTYFKKEKKEVNLTITDGVAIGIYSFSAVNQVLQYKEETIEVSVKEAKLLSLFSERLNQLISREELLKKVWEDDGVFTGRSLDMFISKLRKKLKNDPTVQIMNVHGKGYKLEVGPREEKFA